MTHSTTQHAAQVAKSQRLAGLHTASLDTLAQAQRLFGEHRTLHAARALCHLATNDVAAALEALQAAHRLEQHEAIYTTLGRLYAKASKLQHSAAAYERALGICQQDADVCNDAAGIEVTGTGGGASACNQSYITPVSRQQWATSMQPCAAWSKQ